jgi:hypothetical protein
MRWRTHCGGCLVSVVLIARTAAAADSGAVLDYEVRYGPIQVLAVRTTARFDADRYQASSEVRTVGFVALLFPWSATSDTRGVRADGSMQPQHYRSAGEYRGQHRLAEIDYDAGGSVRAQVDPPAEVDDRDPVPAGLQQATVDPLTASLTAVATGCRGTLHIFDGRRRYDLQLVDLGEADTPPSRYAMYSGRARHCRALIQPLAGFWRSQAYQDERPSQIDFWLATPRAGLIAVPVYLELSAARGTLAIHLAAAAPLATPAPVGG